MRTQCQRGFVCLRYLATFFFIRRRRRRRREGKKRVKQVREAGRDRRVRKSRFLGTKGASLFLGFFGKAQVSTRGRSQGPRDPGASGLLKK